MQCAWTPRTSARGYYLTCARTCTRATARARVVARVFALAVNEVTRARGVRVRVARVRHEGVRLCTFMHNARALAAHRCVHVHVDK